MPPNDTPALAQQSSNRKRAASERVVPAIPLALSKPRSSKPKPRPEPESRAVVEAVRQEDDVTAPLAVENDHNHGERTVVEGAEGAAAGINGVRMAATDTPISGDSGPMSLSNGATRELPATTEAPRPSTPPAAAPDTSLSASPASSRKPTDRFDMRHIRTELPPAFVPAAEQYTPKSAASSHSNRQPPFHPHAHPPHPGSAGIVFGSQGSSTSSPAPPFSASSAFMPPQYPSFGAMQQPYFAPQGHAHHASEPQAQRMYHLGYQQPPSQWSRPSYQQHTPQTPYFHPTGHIPFRYPPRDIFTPADSQQPNGHSSRSRSISQASSGPADQPKSAAPLQSPIPLDQSAENTKMMFREPKAAFPGHAHPRQSQFSHQMPPPPPPQFGHPDPTSEFQNAENLRAHVWSSFANPSLADCILEIRDDFDGKQQRIDAHKLVLSRSPTLISLVQKTKESSTTDINLQGHHIRFGSFMDAVKYLYGGPLLQLDHQRPGSSSGEHIPSNVERMETALQHIATGAWLKVPIIASRGVEVAGSLLHWDTIAKALGFALDGGLSSIWSVDDGSEDRASTSSSDDSLTRAENTGTPTYDPYSTHLLQRIIDSTVHVFPFNFYLDSSAPQLAACPRLPPLLPGHESRPSLTDPRLSQIRFGEIPADSHQRPSFTTSTISSILLSLPFALLKCVLEHFDLAGRMGPDTVASIMRQVVAERESRRMKVLKARSSGQADDSTDQQLVQNLYWEEFVESSPQHRAGFRLARRKRDIDTPPSSGPCSERNK